MPPSLNRDFDQAVAIIDSAYDGMPTVERPKTGKDALWGVSAKMVGKMR